MLVFFVDKLNAEFPLGKCTTLDRFPQIAAVKISVLT